MSDVLSGTLEEISEQIEELNIKVSVLVGYDRENCNWVVLNVDQDGNLKVAS
jgi:hypothetical protein